MWAKSLYEYLLFCLISTNVASEDDVIKVLNLLKKKNILIT